MARLLILLAIVAGACASPAPPSLETTTLLDGLPAAIWPADPTLVADVACPDLVVTPIPQATTCTAVLGGEGITVPIVVDEDGAVTAEVTERLFDVGAAADELEAQLAADLGIAASTFTISCDRVVMLAASAASSTCTADRAGDVIDLRIVLLDATGRWEPQFGPPG